MKSVKDQNNELILYEMFDLFRPKKLLNANTVN
jgi:hypothetical protein